MSKKTLYLRCEPDEIGECALLTGDPARVERIAGMLDNHRVVARNREFCTVTGSYRGQEMSAVSSGIGASSAAIALEELALLGVKAVVRVGTMMGLDLPMGTFVLASGAARFEGTSASYAPPVFPAVPDWSLAHNLLDAAARGRQRVAVGITATYDAFYPKMAPALVNRGLPDMETLREMNVIAVDMETSLVYVVGQRLRLATASMCLVTNNADPFEVIDNGLRDERETALITSVLEGLCLWRGCHE